MRIAIVGGSGTLGRPVTEQLRARGHEARVLSRNSADHPVDLRTGAGLAAALADCEVVVDASNASGKAAATLVEGSARLLAAEQRAGVRHHVCVSIVGCDRVPLGYYQVKTRQEQVVRSGPVPWTIVRATQFHELVAGMLAPAARWGVLPAPKARLQTVAAAEAATAVADVAEAEPTRGQLEVAGPEVREVAELARTWRSVTGRRALLLPVPLPGKLGRALRAGGLCSDQPDVRGELTFADWLARRGR
jgi:uncharacterized protein YbjT (DUF2867 family)